MDCKLNNFLIGLFSKFVIQCDFNVFNKILLFPITLIIQRRHIRIVLLSIKWQKRDKQFCV